MIVGAESALLGSIPVNSRICLLITQLSVGVQKGYLC